MDRKSTTFLQPFLILEILAFLFPKIINQLYLMLLTKEVMFVVL